jgi:NADPH:quinone reductase-like Zn-dependent oxidoreductase
MLPTTMQAIRVYKAGGPEELILEEIPIPQPGENEVLLKVYAAGIIQTDWSVRQGNFFRPMTFPYTPGSALSGVVAAVGPNVTEFQVGQAVFGRAANGNGANAQYAIAPVTTLALKPENITLDQAATFSGGANVAYCNIIEQGDVQPGQRVLIHGGAGSIGSYAIQFAKHKGAYVIATAHTSNVEFVRSLGAHEVIDYARTRFEDAIEQVDLVLDNVGGETMTRSLDVTKPGGLLICMLQVPPKPEEAEKRGIRAEGGRIRMVPEVFQSVANLINREHITVAIARTFPLREARQAHAFGEGRHVRGRIVLHVAD